jgi:hypothetical protein
MKKLYPLLLIISLATTRATAQSSKQVQWNFEAKKIDSKTYEIKMNALIGYGFHLYAQNVGVEGPQPTVFEFVKTPLITLQGAVKENGKLIKKFETAWNSNVHYYEQTVSFVQLVKLKGNLKSNVAGHITFMVCNESKCLPPSTIDFKIPVGG